ncbi:uncharacterized protein LOC127010652 [Drosophila biarmipes]|uniref:uncharacterized protein LOC127010652 n=1 Tax=Drosophila biarmipes TaxID=125945 RepID=UPI0021CCBE9D|nr:uncharacterized protein LOC127010652 [Drosophila biarmipes]
MDKMRQLLLICLFGIALQRAVASLEDFGYSDKVKLITETLETRLDSFGEALNLRLDSFENRLTQSECSKKLTISNGRSQSFDYASFAERMFDKFINISVAR